MNQVSGTKFYSRCLLAYFFFVCFLSLFSYQEQHPDEWYQVIDLANLLVNGASFGDGAIFHHRNLMVPALLALPMLALKGLGITSPYLVFSLLKFLVGLLNLSVLWGMLRLWKVESKNVPAYSLLFVLFCLAQFSLEEAVRPSLEHFSSIFFWLMIASWTYKSNKGFFGAGLFAVLIGAARYPSGILGVVFVLMIALSLLKKGAWRNLFSLSIGVLAGLVCTFAMDAWYYGRAYESLYMYLQYNVLTSLAVEQFGKQSSWEYLVYFWKKFEFYILFLPFMVMGLILGLKNGVRTLKPWVFAFLACVLLHAFPEHKEGRFASSFLFLLIFIVVWGFQHWVVRWNRTKTMKALLGLSLTLGIIAIVEKSYRQIVGDRFLFSRIMSDQPDVDCIVTGRPYPAFMFSREWLLDPNNSFGVMAEGSGKIEWVRTPLCKKPVLLLTKKASQDFSYCELDSKRRSLVPPLLSRADVYLCPLSELEKKYSFTVLNDILVTKIYPHSALPPLGINAQELFQFMKETEKVHHNKD